MARDVLALLLAWACAGCMAGVAPRTRPRSQLAPAEVGDQPTPPLAEGADAAAQDAGARTGQPSDAAAEPIAPASDAPPAAQSSAASVAPSPADARAFDSASDESKWLHGSLAVRYRGRTGGGDQDHELRGVLALDLADPKGSGQFSAHVLARADVDLEGLDEGEIFSDLQDTYDEAVVGKLYLAYADIALAENPEKSPGTLRVGRQTDSRLPAVLRLDGVSYVTRPLGKHEVEVGVYGGVPVRLYDSSTDGDRAYGTFVEERPWQGGRVRADWMHLEDEELLGSGNDDLIALGLWQDLAEHWRLEGEYTHLESDPRDLRLRAFYDANDAATIVRVGYYELLETQTTHATELDPFSEQLLEYFPFRQTTLNVSQVVSDHVVVDAGFDMRRVSDSGDVGEFNREWERYYATATYDDLGTQGLALSVTGDLWDDEDIDTSSFGADLSYEVDERWKASIGTYYSLYKYHLLELEERDDVRTYYARASKKVSESVAFDVVYEFEDDDLETYNTLRVGAAWRF